MEKEIIVIGAGAAGFFAAITASITLPGVKIGLLEKARATLAKVRISGGGRCNVTHACFDPKELIKNYPRGSKELLGPFYKFQPKDMISWLEGEGVQLKTEGDGRMFPITDSSETIIAALTNAAKRGEVDLINEISIESITPFDGGFLLNTDRGQIKTKKLILATGSAPQGHRLAEQLGHTLTPLAPSLFSLNVPTSPLLDLSGIAVEDVEVSIVGKKLNQRGPILLTHWGFSGPAILKLSAWGARSLKEVDYQATLQINWAPDLGSFASQMDILRKEKPSKRASLQDFTTLPKKLSERLFPENKIYAQLTKADCAEMEEVLLRSTFQISGKTTYKQEFVTCGGVSLKEVDFQTMESKLCKGLYFAGEILDIDGVTGGFNFQNAWTTGYLAGRSAACN